MDGDRRLFLYEGGTPRKKWTTYKADDGLDSRALKAHRAAATQLAEPLGDDLRAFRRDLNAVLTRGVWKLFRIARDEYRQVAGRTCRRRFSRSARARAGPAGAAWGVHAIPVPPRVALPPPAGRRVPGYQRGSVATGLAPGAVVARRHRHGTGPAARADDLRGRRSQAVDLWVSRRRCTRAGQSCRADSPVAGRSRSEPRDSPELSRGTSAAVVHQRSVHGARQAPRSRRRLHLRGARRVSSARDRVGCRRGVGHCPERAWIASRTARWV